MIVTEAKAILREYLTYNVPGQHVTNEVKKANAILNWIDLSPNEKPKYDFAEICITFGFRNMTMSDFLNSDGQLIIDKVFFYIPLVAKGTFVQRLKWGQVTAKTHKEVIQALVDEKRVFIESKHKKS